MEIGDYVFFITQDGGVKYGKIKNLNYYKDRDREGTWYELNSMSSDNATAVMLEYTSSHVFKSADEALTYLEETQKPILKMQQQ